MTVPEDRFESDRAARETALARLKGHAEAFKRGLQQRPVKQRVAEDIAGKARNIAGEALEVANDSKPVVAGTLGLLALWFLRRTLAGAVRKIWPAVTEVFRDKAK